MVETIMSNGMGNGMVGPHTRLTTTTPIQNQRWLNTKVIVSLGQLMKLAPNLSDYLTCHVLMPQDKETKGLECEFEKSDSFPCNYN